MSLGVTPSVYACKRLHITYREYCRHTLLMPFLSNVVFGLCLAASRKYYADNMLHGVLMGSITGGFILLLLYYRYILPSKFKKN
jgi:hypothetical protein